MGLVLAFKAFFKALKDPVKAQKFIDDVPENTTSGDHSHLRLLAILQHSGRLLDFLKEDVSKYTDIQIGAAARKIHQDCAKVVEEIITVRPVMELNEGAAVEIPKGYDPSNIKLVGKVKGEPPFKGILVHKGWKAHKHSLPKQVGEQLHDILCPAEVEVR